MVSGTFHAVPVRLGARQGTVIELIARLPADRATGVVNASGQSVGDKPQSPPMYMKRRLLLGSMACAAFPCLAAAPKSEALKPKVLLTVGGLIGRVNNETARTYEFTEEEYLKLATTSITTGTPWTPTSVFVGPLLVDVMGVAGVTNGTLIFTTLGDYSAPIPWEDLVRYGVILAHSQDGQRLNNNRWGPLWTIYPRDQYPDALSGPIAESRFIWQVDRIEVRA